MIESDQNKLNNENQPRAWYEKVVIPTYEIGEKEKYPMFLEKRVYQGSSGVVYPYPVIEKVTDNKVDKEWLAIYLENKYLKIMILPEIGGRIQMAWDKTKERHFVYYNSVIKPALVGLTGPWISGGIEFNWPQHHRPSTFDPVDHSIEHNEDGSVTVWCSEIERMFRTKGMAGFTLHPDKAYLEIKVKLYNRTDYPQTFLWWANPAVKVNEHYQSVFPPDVNAVFDHGKRAVSSFPIARGTYYKVDYSPGTDISRYNNIPVPTSYMAITSQYDFVGGYENDTQGGLLHVANHHVSPGKKQWTWGNGEFGQAWDRHLTDEDGPYIELMCGVYTDNQPDFSWLMPGEEKSFRQYFMPYRDLGVVKNATPDAMVNLEFADGMAHIKAYTTSEYAGTKIILYKNDNKIFEDTYDFHPNTSYSAKVVAQLATSHDIFHIVLRHNEKVLVEWQSEFEVEKPIPDPALAIGMPQEIKNIEDLYLAGLHLEQYRHATYDPRDYYLEALRRSPGDLRCNNAMGLWFLKRGAFDKAEAYFRAAVNTSTRHNPNPADGQPHYNLGLSLLMQDKINEAYDAFYKATWNAATMDIAYFQVARLDGAAGRWNSALENIERSLARNAAHQKARHLKVAALRKTSRPQKALLFLEESINDDRFNLPLYFEKYLITDQEQALKTMQTLIRKNIHNYIEFALDYAGAGMLNEAFEFISLGISQQTDEQVYPLAYYFKAWIEYSLGQQAQYLVTLKQAQQASPDFCFPNQPEFARILRWALKVNPSDARAAYCLGNLYYNARLYDEAIKCWEASAKADPSFPIVHRNLSLGLFNKKNDATGARNALEKAFELDNTNARVLMELDQLYKRLNVSPKVRLQLLEKYLDLVEQRDDLYLERVTLYNLCGRFEEAHELIMRRKFHPWEGGEGRVIEQYRWSLIALAKRALAANDIIMAGQWLDKAILYPENLGEAKLFGFHDNEADYLRGVLYRKMGNETMSNVFLMKATRGQKEPSMAMFYNDQQPDMIYWQGMAWQALGNNQKAMTEFDKLVDFGKAHLEDEVKIDYFAVSLPDLLIWEEDLKIRNKLLCLYLMGLGFQGKGEKTEAEKIFKEILTHNISHAGANIHIEAEGANESFYLTSGGQQLESKEDNTI